MTAQRSFGAYVGVDYSGASRPYEPISGLSVFRARDNEAPEEMRPGTGGRWSRKVLAEHLGECLAQNSRTMVGIDHAFSIPIESMEQHGARSWDAFLEYFTSMWQTDKRSVEKALADGARLMGKASDLRMTDRWTSSAKSVFVLDGQGQVGKSTHSGIPWLLYLRRHLGDSVHFWPFDGFSIPEGKSVVAEVYPSLFKKRYPHSDYRDHKLDAYSVCRWLQDRDSLGFLNQYFTPSLSPEEGKTAILEGWILGVM